jgi:hypothetical protein
MFNTKLKIVDLIQYPVGANDISKEHENLLVL